MIDLIKDIFQTADFEVLDADSFILFSLKERTSYWIVKETETLDFLKEQDDLFLKAKERSERNPAFDKNASLILLHKVADDADLKEIKKNTGKLI